MGHGRKGHEALDSTLRFIAQQGWLETGRPFLESLVEFLGGTLGVAYVLVDELLPSGTRARTVALYANGAPAHNIEYDLEFTPCENVMNKRLCAYPQDLQAAFPRDDLLVQMRAESYIGMPLWDSKGEPLGLIAIMDTRPMQDIGVKEEVVQAVALRTAHELERRRDASRLAEYYADLESAVAERTAELVKAKQQQEETNAEVAAINDKLKDMTGMVTHDIANQLLVLNGNMAFLEARTTDEGTLRILERMEKALQNIARSVQVAGEYRVVGAKPVWQDIETILGRLSCPIMNIDPSIHGLSIYADPMLEKVFFNLLDNSEKHGRDVTAISVQCCKEGDLLKIVWEDDGVGIPEEKKTSLFEPRVEEDRPHGLFLISRILGRTGIAIEENGVPGKGARFVLNVPAAASMFSSE